MHLTVLGSGSSGNCAVVTTDSTTLLVDAGLSARQIVRGLESVGRTLDDLDGILLTHEHQDHIGGLELLSQGRALALFCNALTQDHLLCNLSFRTLPAWRLMPTGSNFDYNDLRIESFSVSYDAVDPVGYVLASESARLSILSDVGFVTDLIKERLRGSDAVFVEANYDDQLLEFDTKRPSVTKERISSRLGHLSNDQVAELIGEIVHPRLRNVVLGHLSEDCNNPSLASKHVRSALDAAGAKYTRVICAELRKQTSTIKVAENR
jgi:phosphoribosyl 1,2-cyclic phosphodiesterase